MAEIEAYALSLARHFVDDIEPVSQARIEVEEYAWERPSRPWWFPGCGTWSC